MKKPKEPKMNTQILTCPRSVQREKMSNDEAFDRYGHRSSILHVPFVYIDQEKLTKRRMRSRIRSIFNSSSAVRHAERPEDEEVNEQTPARIVVQALSPSRSGDDLKI
jgi:hypothetical protein